LGHRALHRLRRYAALACLLTLAWAAPAAADGDPASDILTLQDVYYGVGIDLRSKAAAQLPAMLQQARERGFETKVALISDFTDLGIATFLWDDPQGYATYLGQEIGLVYKQHLLVLMPKGYGYYRFEQSGLPERRRLRGLEPPASADEFLASAMKAVQRLAAAEGVRLSVPDVEPPPGGVTQPKSHYSRDSPVIPALPSATPTAAAAKDSGGGGVPEPLLYLAPVGVGALVAGGFILAGRRRSRNEFQKG
jgi:hypothetical protein